MKITTVFTVAAFIVAPSLANAQDSSPASPPSAIEAPGNAALGKQMYSRNCAICHGAAGRGGLGPALKGVKDRLSPEDIAKQLAQPKGEMPKFYPNALNTQDVRDLISYLSGL